MRGNRKPSAEALAKLRTRREFEARARRSLALRHGQAEFERSVALEARKVLERSGRGQELHRLDLNIHRRNRVEAQNKAYRPGKVSLNTWWPAGYTQERESARRRRQMEKHK